MRRLARRTTQAIAIGARRPQWIALALVLLTVSSIGADPLRDDDKPPPDQRVLFAAQHLVGVGAGGPLPTASTLSVLLDDHWFELEVPIYTQMTTVGRMALGGASTTFMASQGPFTALAFLEHGGDCGLWSFFDPHVVHSIPWDELAAIRDDTGVGEEMSGEEAYAHSLMLIWANRTDPEAFDEAAKENAAVGYSQLSREAASHRGQVVHVSGQLVRVRRYETKTLAARQGGVHDFYEGWIALPGDKPVCVVFTELPPGLEVKDKMNVPASFSGYFFKRFRYEAIESAKTKKPNFAPILIGRTVTLTKPPAGLEAPVAIWNYVATLFVTVVLLTAGGIALMTWWFRRNDQRVRARVEAARYGQFALPPSTAAPVAAPLNFVASIGANEPEVGGPPAGHNRLREGPGRLPQSGSE
jgi:hypothetical protein